MDKVIDYDVQYDEGKAQSPDTKIPQSRSNSNSNHLISDSQKRNPFLESMNVVTKSIQNETISERAQSKSLFEKNVLDKISEHSKINDEDFPSIDHNRLYSIRHPQKITFASDS